MPNSGKVGPGPEVALEIDASLGEGRKNSEIGDLGDAFNFLFMGSNPEGLEQLERVSESDTITLKSLDEDIQDHLQVQSDVPPKTKRSKQRRKSVITYNSSRRPSLVDGILDGELANFQDQDAIATDKSLYQVKLSSFFNILRGDELISKVHSYPERVTIAPLPKFFRRSNTEIPASFSEL